MKLRLRILVDVQINVDLQATVAGLDKLLAKADVAARYAIGQVALEVQAQAGNNAKTGHHPLGQGHIPGTGPGPNTVTGRLIQSIDINLVKGFNGYVATIGPGAVYARAVEMGHPKWKSGVKYPYMIPAGKTVKKKASKIFANAFNRKWSH